MTKLELLFMMIILVTMFSTAHLAVSFQVQESIYQLISYTHVWPEMEFSWRIVLATIVVFIAAASGSAGGSVGGGFFVAVLVLIVGFDIKSSAAMSNCMVMATTYLSLRKKNPTFDQPLADYDLALLIQPMLLLGVGIGVTFNVIFAEWMLTLLLVLLFLVMSIRAFIKSVEAWNKETNATKEATQELSSTAGSDESEYEPLMWRPHREPEVQRFMYVHWKEVGVLFAVWIVILVLQISKSSTTSCSVAYWILDLSQIPVAVGAFLYEAIKRYRAAGIRRNPHRSIVNWKAHELALCCVSAVLAGMLSAMLGLGGGFILCPLLLHFGISPQVSSATAALAITFSSSISVVEYYLLKRFPVPYAIYFFGVAMAGTVVGDVVVTRVIRYGGRTSVVIFVLASTILITALLLGGNGMIDVVYMVEGSEYMGFESLCT